MRCQLAAGQISHRRAGTLLIPIETGSCRPAPTSQLRTRRCRSTESRSAGTAHDRRSTRRVGALPRARDRIWRDRCDEFCGSHRSVVGPIANGPPMPELRSDPRREDRDLGCAGASLADDLRGAEGESIRAAQLMIGSPWTPAVHQARTASPGPDRRHVPPAWVSHSERTDDVNEVTHEEHAAVPRVAALWIASAPSGAPVRCHHEYLREDESQ
jgi:hypothetical protein